MKDVSDTFKIRNEVSFSSKIVDTERVIFTKRNDGSSKKSVIKETFANVAIRKKQGRKWIDPIKILLNCQ